MTATRKHRIVRVGVVAVLAAAGCAVAGGSADADVAPSSTDVVGVGSDIVQNSLDFLADGTYSSDPAVPAQPGYNGAGNKNRLISFDATADGNGRNAFVDPALVTKATQLNPTITLRAGTYPVQRPNGGGAGINALIGDGKNGTSSNLISFVRSPNLLTAKQQQDATNNLGTPLHTVQIADDKQYIATATTTNAPSVLTPNDLYLIYTGGAKTWGALPDYTGTDAQKAQTIVPLLPQSTSGVYKVFINALTAQNPGKTLTLTDSIRYVQQNDPTTITGLNSTDQPNAIVPFPLGRYTVLNSGYFHDPNAAYTQLAPATALDASGITLHKDAGSFVADLPYYIIFRESDLASTKPWQPGGTLNWVQTLFCNPGGPAPYVDSADGQAILRAAGVTPDYHDLDNNTSG